MTYLMFVSVTLFVYSEKRTELARIREQLEANGATLPPEKPASEHFDSNCITPVSYEIKVVSEISSWVMQPLGNATPG